jgi:hypothetical protein
MQEVPMHTRNERNIGEGIGFGIVAGLTLLIANISASLAAGLGAMYPVRAAASVVYGGPAFDPSQLADANALVIGLGVHLALSAFFGSVYAMVMAWRSHETRTSWQRQAAFGLGFGLLVWFTNFQVVARAIYPWMLGDPQLEQALMHAVFFGLPMGVLYATAERRADLVEPAYQVH